jgi:hypothetical protein
VKTEKNCFDLSSWFTKEEVGQLRVHEGTADYTDIYGEADNLLNGRKHCRYNSSPMYYHRIYDYHSSRRRCDERNAEVNLHTYFRLQVYFDLRCGSTPQRKGPTTCKKYGTGMTAWCDSLPP